MRPWLVVEGADPDAVVALATTRGATLVLSVGRRHPVTTTGEELQAALDAWATGS